MNKYAVFNADGLPLAFYSEDVHGRRTIPLYGEPDEETGVRPVIGEAPNPQTKVPTDALAISDAQWMEFLNHQGRRRWQDGAVVLFDPPPPPITVDDYTRAIQARLDAKARERQYDGIQTAITYRDDPNPRFAAEGDALFAWRSAVWTYSTAELVKVLAGERPQPSVEEFIAELPPFTWPS
jgi:hypothetical protein